MNQDPIAALGSAILATYHSSNFPSGPKRSYSPEGSLSTLITVPKTEEVLTSLKFPQGSEKKALVNFIVSEAPKLLAIMLMIDISGEQLKKALRSFSHHRFRDKKHLPLKPEDFDQKPDKGTWSSCCLGWTKNNLENFCDRQWFFLAPRFVKNDKSEWILFNSRIIFPLKLVGNMPAEGAFGKVWRAEAHKSHFGEGKVRTLIFPVIFCDYIAQFVTFYVYFSVSKVALGLY